MSNYHEQTLKLLGSEGVRQKCPNFKLTKWAETNGIILPGAYLEWAELDGKKLLEKYSNSDRFEFDQPQIIITPQGLQGIRFHTENQGNFSKIVLLQGDNPPVLWVWNGQPPRWIIYTERFSNCVFAQIFDWQYWLELDNDEPEDQTIYTSTINLKTSRCVNILRERFQEVVSTRYVVEDEQLIEYRFLKSLKERMRVTVGKDKAARIEITGEYSLIVVLEMELVETFADDVVGYYGLSKE